MELIDALARRAPLQKAVMTVLPKIALPLIECTHEADPRLRDGGIKVRGLANHGFGLPASDLSAQDRNHAFPDPASQALEAVAGTIDHIETVKLRPLLLKALVDVDHTNTWWSPFLPGRALLAAASSTARHTCDKR